MPMTGEELRQAKLSFIDEELKSGRLFRWLKGVLDAQENDLEDIVAESLAAFMNAGKPASPAEFRAFLAGIAKHKVADFLRREYRRRRRETSLSSLPGEEAECLEIPDKVSLDPYESLAQSEECLPEKHVLAACPCLSDREQQILQLRRDGKKNAEIAEILKASQTAIRKSWSRLLGKLRRRFGARGKSG